MLEVQQTQGNTAGSSTQTNGTSPVHTMAWSNTIEGHQTEFILSIYANRALLIATQTESVGTVLTSGNDAAIEAQGPTFSVNVVIGKRDEPLLPLCARQIVEAAAKGGFHKPIMVCLGLKVHSMPAIKQVVNSVLEHAVWR